ncbi:metal-sulfur cluster assembly factor [Bradyrhizobium canariense]|uniref:Metal-sulfur cluster biosynthetic enzyme n=1 Tax=Bradyrhizobium canariense TaxID=255045 RepID=A0A1H2AYD4_9BRAD|nr:iron-sulfur cluster assembly protein [Bradyrhizobium canariense]SDT50963.1 Metal-sulfur cluster biosynthetic enzyme [Bradyrhizobium canariense]
MNGGAEEADRSRNRQIHDKQAEVLACLQDVMDPELDESVTDLNFVTKADVDSNNRVHIEFRLPTYWCAANFSFLMADDMRRAVNALDWVEGVSVVLGEHMYADRINAGLARGLSFQETFGAEADGDLDDLRQTFLVKAFQRRQVALLNHLVGAGHAPETIVSLTLAELGCLPVDDDGAKLVRRYLERRAVAGPPGADVPAFVDATGARLKTDGFAAYVSGLRRVGINAEFNGALCRGLLAVRFDLETPFVPKSKASPGSSDTQHVP